jgi:hypothetical protein
MTDPVDDALQALAAAFPASEMSYVRRDTGPRVVQTLRGNFQEFGPFPPGSFDQGSVIPFIEQFWTGRRRLFDPSASGTTAQMAEFKLTGRSAQQAVIAAQQVVTVSGEAIELSGAILAARVAARPAAPGCPVTWQLDAFDNNLVTAPTFEPTIVPPDPDAAVKAASRAAFGRPDVLASSAKVTTRSFPDSKSQHACLMIAFPSQPRLRGRWKRGAIVYWSLEEKGGKLLRIEPDGSYAQALPGNTGPYHPQATSLYVLPAAAADQYELVDDSFQNRQGPRLRTGRFTKGSATALPAFEPLVGAGWRDAAVASRLNPGVATDAHAFARDVVGALLDMRDRNGIVGPVLPASVDVAIQVYPAAQPGEWRKSASAAIIANADDSLPRSWLKRWTYCSDNTVLAHEIAHGLVYEGLTLDYSLESGALDEALADLFTVLVTGTTAIFDRPWIREDTRYVHAAAALREASWSGTISRARVSPNDRVERGEYPNHYVDFARLASTNDKAAKLSKPRNDHGYMHWNCAIVTRALAMLARPAPTQLRHPETGLTATAIGTIAVGDLTLSALRLVLMRKSIGNNDPEGTPFARLREALLSAATSPQFDRVDGNGNDWRLYAAEVINVCNAAGIGPILSVRGRPDGVPERCMPPIRLDPPAWVVKFEQEGREPRTWNPDHRDPIDLVRGKDVVVTVQIANLGVSTDRAIPRLSILLEAQRDATAQPSTLTAADAAFDSRRLAPGAVVAQSVTIANADLPDLADPWILVTATDAWNSLRSRVLARAAIKAALSRQDFALPLNAALIRLRLDQP